MTIRRTQGRKALYNSVLDTVGDTPVIRLNRMDTHGATLFVKAESFNPGGSVKDRLALNIIEAAEREGKLLPGQTIVEATSGNTGIGLAMICAAKGYPLVITMAESFSVERRQLMRFYGAKVILTPKEGGGLGMYQKAVELAEANGWFLARQFETTANADIHESTTAQEILADFDGQPLTHIVTGYGTGGTVTGLGRAIRAARPDVRIVLSEPEGAMIVESGIAQTRTADGAPAAAHPAHSPHPIQGWVPNFVPLVLQEAIDKGFFDAILPVNGPEAMDCARQLAAQEGIFTGVSGGATLATALKVAKDAPAGAAILTMLPDTGERYLSTPLFEGIETVMSEEERALSQSTPSLQMS